MIFSCFAVAGEGSPPGYFQIMYLYRTQIRPNLHETKWEKPSLSVSETKIVFLFAIQKKIVRN